MPFLHILLFVIVKQPMMLGENLLAINKGGYYQAVFLCTCYNLIDWIQLSLDQASLPRAKSAAQ